MDEETRAEIRMQLTYFDDELSKFAKAYKLDKKATQELRDLVSSQTSILITLLSPDTPFGSIKRFSKQATKQSTKAPNK